MGSCHLNLSGLLPSGISSMSAVGEVQNPAEVMRVGTVGPGGGDRLGRLREEI